MLEIILKKGEIRDDLFDYDPEEQKRFLAAYGLEDAMDRHSREKSGYDLSDDFTQSKIYRSRMRDIEEEITGICKKALADKGLDVDAMIGHRLTEEETKEELLKQLGQFGISPEHAKELGLDDPEALKREGKEFIFEVKDSPKNRESLTKNEILFERKDGKLRINGRFEAKEGIAYDDTPENRKLLDGNEMEYIRFAQGGYGNGEKMKNKLLVPVNWGNAAFPVTNCSLVRNLEKLAMLGASSFVLSPAGAIALLLVLQKSGLYQRLNRPAELKPGEMKALRHGLTVYKEDGKGSRYYYMDKGNVCCMDARNVRLPNVYDGVRLSAAQMDMLRKGKLVTYKDKNGEEAWLRIDVNKSGGLQEYYREMRSDREMKKKPTRLSPDSEKLEWIKSKGMQGIESIYGKKVINLELENFLGRHGLSQAYGSAYEAKERMDMARGGDKAVLMKEFIKENDNLKNKADEALIKEVKTSRGMSL